MATLSQVLRHIQSLDINPPTAWPHQAAAPIPDSTSQNELPQRASPTILNVARMDTVYFRRAGQRQTTCCPP